jgi:hypothetical protein
VDKPRLLDVVKLKAATTGPGDMDDEDVTIEAGETGTIVEVFDRPNEAYLVEFSNDYGEAVAIWTLKPEEFEVVWRSGTAVPEQVRA